ncbi:MAG: iron ABC transporter permease [Nitrospirae bacterium]|nr:iron ABC transporter permease [Nitrospirota bacterium]
MSQITPSNYSSPEISQNVLERPEQDVKAVSPSPFCFTLTPTRWILWIAGLGGLAFLVLLGCLRFGTESIDFFRMVAILFEGMRLGGEERNVADPTSTILLQIRLPRVVLAFMVGGSLAAVGVVLQALLRNPLADPYVIGVSSGAALGAAIAMLFGLSISVLSVSAIPFCAFLGASFSLFIVYRIALIYGGFSIHTLLLAGVVLNAIFSAFIMFLTTLADPNRAFGMYAWLMGSLTGPDGTTLSILSVYLFAGILLMATQSHSLNLLTLGEESARSLGVEVERVKKMLFVAAALVTGAVVAFSGLIGFVGLIVPHAVRLVVGADHRLLLPASGIVGGMFLMIADMVARTILSPAEIPVGVVTALVGGPIFLMLLVQRRGRLL